MNAIKESFDNLPMAVCIFDSLGLVRLMNRRMLWATAILLGSGVQTLEELEYALEQPPEGITPLKNAPGVYRFPDGTVLRFVHERITDAGGVSYHQVTAADVTELVLRQEQLAEENARLTDANRRTQRLLEQMPEIVREQEILAMKMRVHDDIGHSILAARQVLTNCVRHAGGAELYVSAAREEGGCTVTITNNGRPPRGEIIEGGGLSALRRRIEGSGGTMTAAARPRFALTIHLPEKEDIL